MKSFWTRYGWPSSIGSTSGFHLSVTVEPPTFEARILHLESFSKTFDRRLRQTRYAELLIIRLHDLRHTWATLALAAGVDVAIVSNRLGHGPTMTTWATYQHVVQGMQTDAAERVASLIFGPTVTNL